MSKRFGWTLVCPKCHDEPGQFYGVLKVPSEPVKMECPNCGTRLVDVTKVLPGQSFLLRIDGQNGPLFHAVVAKRH